MRPARVPAYMRVATYARVAPGEGRPRATLARRQAHLAATVSAWPGCVHVAAYADTGPAGPLGRPGIARLVADAQMGWFDVVVVEFLGRLSPRPAELRVVVGRLAAVRVTVRPLRAGHPRLAAAGTAAGIVALTELLA